MGTSPSIGKSGYFRRPGTRVPSPRHEPTQEESASSRFPAYNEEDTTAKNPLGHEGRGPKAGQEACGSKAGQEARSEKTREEGRQGESRPRQDEGAPAGGSDDV